MFLYGYVKAYFVCITVYQKLNIINDYLTKALAQEERKFGLLSTTSIDLLAENQNLIHEKSILDVSICCINLNFFWYIYLFNVL